MFSTFSRFGLAALLYGWWNPPFIPFASGVLLLRRACRAGKLNGFRRWASGFLCVFAVVLTTFAFFNYERWLRDLVEVFGGVYHFMDLNSVPRVSDRLFRLRSGVSFHRKADCPQGARNLRDGSIPSDFGRLVTRDNIDEIIAGFRAQASECVKYA